LNQTRQRSLEASTSISKTHLLISWIDDCHVVTLLVHLERLVLKEDTSIVTTPRCCVCGHDSTKSKIKFCHTCRLTTYCSLECQSADWPEHKMTCKMASTYPSGSPHVHALDFSRFCPRTWSSFQKKIYYLHCLHCLRFYSWWFYLPPAPFTNNNFSLEHWLPTDHVCLQLEYQW
jgi:hypothetical protein